MGRGQRELGARLHDEHFFEPAARFLGPAYLRYSFTKGTEAEVEALVRMLELKPGQRVLDAGCGPGRHAQALSVRGLAVVGIDISTDFVSLARHGAGAGAVFLRGDVRDLPVRSESMDAAICLCQGGFGLLGGGEDEAQALFQISSCLREGGRLALTAFSAYFAVRHLEQGESFDASSGVVHETARLKDQAGAQADCELWTTCFTPRELGLMCDLGGLEVRGMWSVAPGQYAENAPDLNHPEWLVVAEKLPSGADKRRW